MIKLSDMTSDELLLYHSMSYARSFNDHHGAEGAGIGRKFEEDFYNYIAREPRFRLLSTSYDFGMGHELATTSGVRHETDAVLSDGLTLYVCELKHYFESQIDKNMLLIFNQKVIDFYLELVRKGIDIHIKRLFLTRNRRLDNFVREFAMSWGIGLVDGELWPPELLRLHLLDYAMRLGEKTPGQDWEPMADELCKYSFRDLSEIMVPFSPMQVTINANEFLGRDECIRLVGNHRKLFYYLAEVKNCRQ
jgi:hypothetical protein